MVLHATSCWAAFFKDAASPDLTDLAPSLIHYWGKNLPSLRTLASFFPHFWKHLPVLISQATCDQSLTVFSNDKKNKRMTKRQTKAGKFACLVFCRSAVIPSFPASSKAKECASMRPHNCWITLRGGEKCLEVEQNALAPEVGGQAFQGAVRRQGRSLTTGRWPQGQNEGCGRLWHRCSKQKA